ncbi:hypothetical protein NQ318_000690 [Aromia moschata]|uniref:Reverse transcriptase zinc-binding domain-containing protein n=1 Tax=Aromia moschata TaxID=1265417 RepID=A0AAV8XAM6_9CUCU|nr:hypothetical protein NQ318_000690 [Aromia moschata]
MQTLRIFMEVPPSVIQKNFKCSIMVTINWNQNPIGHGLSQKLMDFHNVSKPAEMDVGLFTGYCPLMRHLTTIGVKNDPDCRRCGEEEETSFHILYECPALAAGIRTLGL